MNFEQQHGSGSVPPAGQFQVDRAGGRQMSSMNERISFAADQEEHNLLNCARAGNAEAFEKLVKPHWDVLFRVTQRILRNREDAEDALQTALLHAWRNLIAFQGRSRFSSWLTRIAVNAALMRLRASRRKNEVSLDEMVQASAPAEFHVVEARPNPEREFSAKEVLGLVNEVLGHLKPHHVEILQMSLVQELTGKESAQILDVSVNTVKARLHRARATLSQAVQPMIGPRGRGANAANGGAATLAPGMASGD
jgi:RNA polymerase sigma-70 factor, ECF subfamily